MTKYDAKAVRNQITAVLDQFTDNSFHKLNADLMAQKIESDVIAPLMCSSDHVPDDRYLQDIGY